MPTTEGAAATRWLSTGRALLNFFPASSSADFELRQFAPCIRRCSTGRDDGSFSCVTYIGPTRPISGLCKREGQVGGNNHANNSIDTNNGRRIWPTPDTEPRQTVTQPFTLSGRRPSTNFAKSSACASCAPKGADAPIRDNGLSSPS